MSTDAILVGLERIEVGLRVLYDVCFTSCSPAHKHHEKGDAEREWVNHLESGRLDEIVDRTWGALREPWSETVGDG